jgi:uncharacterized membrane protein YjjB (DUF3815 family)
MERTMTLTVDLVLLIIAAVCFFLAFLAWQPRGWNLIGLGLFAWVLTFLV